MGICSSSKNRFALPEGQAAKGCTVEGCAKDAIPGKMHGMTLSCSSLGPILFAQHMKLGEMEMCNLMEGAHMKPEYLAKNPFHLIPTWEGADGFCIGESNAVLRYLAANFATSYYPEDALLRARIDWALDATMTNVYEKWGERMYPIFEFGHSKGEENKQKVNEEFKAACDSFVKSFLRENQKYVCGDSPTIADFKMLPYLVAVNQPIVKQKTGLKLSPRLEKYVENLLKEIPAAGMLSSAGGFSIGEWLSTKTHHDDWTGELCICGEGVCEMPDKRGAAFSGEKGGKIWGLPASSNSMSCVLFAQDAGVGGLSMLDITKGEQMTPEFLAKNPFHQIPTYEGSDGFTMAESGAILRFLAANYRPEAYPSDVRRRALVDWACDVTGATVYQKIGYGVYYPVFGFTAPPASQEEANKAALEAVENFEKAFLKESKFVGGDSLTIAEYKIVPHLFAVSQPAVEKKTGFKLPPRMLKYMEEAIAQMQSSPMLSSCGGFSLKEYAATKE